MKARFRLLKMNSRGGTFYSVDCETGKRASLGTADEYEALQIINAKNESLRQGWLNLQLGRVYLSGTDSGAATRSWQHAMTAIVDSKAPGSENRFRWEKAIKEKAFDLIRNKVILETKAEDLQAVLNAGRVSTNVFLRRIQNYCVGMNWLPWPLLPKKQFPPVKFKEKRAITLAEHQRIIERENNPERRAFYELCWHLGGSQTDIASLHAEDIDRRDRTLAYTRRKSRSPALQRFGESVERILKDLPAEGPLFPRLRTVRSSDRATEFGQRCERLRIEGVTLHSYRYAWAERARTAGYPERFAQEALGHNSRAVHQAYAKKAKVIIPPLEDYERTASGKILPLPPQVNENLAVRQHSTQA